MRRIKVPSPCKINLHLSVGERRADGYHDLESIFQVLDFGDILGFELVEEDGVCELLLASPLLRTVVPIPPEKNIVYQAVSLFRRRTGFDRGIRVSLEKRAPLGGGLGGGSSNAAAALGALDILAGTGLSLAELRDMALALGSDVPFFLAEAPARGESSAAYSRPGHSAAGRGGAAWVSGRGERIFPLGDPRSWPVVLVNPGFPSPTGEAFRRLDAWRSRLDARRSRGGGSGEGPGRGALIGALGAEPGDWPFWNDFFPVLAEGSGEDAVVYRRIVSALRNSGAVFTGLSGAGSTCFGIFTDRGEAERAAHLLSDHWFFVYVTFFLARSAFGVLEY
ncbi:MAG: 4-(cytidine 5'-diphospho)-2-C-methyl-D-erythritol kinase [Treponema sp.]|nr:4-(cytidine 5'-diphospho)-2-C-methyl-D-erythritol kinase [Treponema sp.]